MPSWMSLGFQDTSSTSMVELSCLHDYIMVVMLLVVVLVSYIIVYLLLFSEMYKYFVEGTLIETVWSIVPAFILVILVVPSMKVLYLMEDIKFPVFSFKVVGHQWYWSYVTPFLKNISFKVNDVLLGSYNFDSIMEAGFSSFPRLLSSSSELYLPMGSTSRILVSSSDVIHAFSVPALGLKVDAFPGRINQLYVNPSRLGLFFGQCSEICGSNHSFMPISFKIVCPQDFFLVSEDMLLDSISSTEGL